MADSKANKDAEKPGAKPPMPAKPAGAKTAEIVSAPLELDCEVGEGTVKEAYVTSDIAATRRAAELLRASAPVAKKGPIRVGASDGTKVPGDETAK